MGCSENTVNRDIIHLSELIRKNKHDKLNLMAVLPRLGCQRSLAGLRSSASLVSGLAVAQVAHVSASGLSEEGCSGPSGLPPDGRHWQPCCQTSYRHNQKRKGVGV